MSDIFYEDDLYNNIDSYIDDYDTFDISESLMDTDDEWDDYEEYMEEYDDYEDIFEERSRQKTTGKNKKTPNVPKKKWTKKEVIKTAVATIAIIGTLLLVLKKVKSAAKKNDIKPSTTQSQQIKSQPPRRDPEPEKKAKRTLRVKTKSAEIGGSKWHNADALNRRMDSFLQRRDENITGFNTKKAEYKKAANRGFQNSSYAKNRHGYLDNWNPNDPIGSCDRMIKNLENHKADVIAEMSKLKKIKGGKNQKNKKAREKYDNDTKSVEYYNTTKEEILSMKKIFSIAAEVDQYKSEVAKAANKMRVPIPKSVL